MSSDLFLETVTRINIHSSMCLLCMCLCVFKCLRSRLFILVVCLDIGVLSNLDYMDVFDFVLHDRFLCNSHFTHCKIFMSYSFFNEPIGTVLVVFGISFVCRIISQDSIVWFREIIQNKQLVVKQ